MTSPFPENATHPSPDLLIGTHLLSHTVSAGPEVYTNFSPISRSSNSSLDDETEENPFDQLDVPYALVETLVAIAAVIGNAAVIIVFQQEKRLRRRTNYYIVSLAFADFLVGLLGVPFAVLASVGLPRNLHACLCTITLLVVLCTISIFCLVAVSIDRYWAILHPIKYSRNVSTRTAIIIISLCWIAGSFVGFLPLLGWHSAKEGDQACLFVEVMDYNYLVFLYFLTIITPAIILAGFYAHIYSVILTQMKATVTVNDKPDPKDPSKKAVVHQIRRERGGTMLRVLGAAQKREVKATQNLSIIVIFYMICWVPLYTINCINAFCGKCLTEPWITNFCIILSHLNSALNPILYAYHLRDFRRALKTSMMRLCGMKIPADAEPRYKVSLVNAKRDGITSRDSQPRIFVDVKTNSPSPRTKHSTQLPCIPSSIVNLTVDTHCKIWQLVDSPVKRVGSLDEAHAKSYLSTKLETPNGGQKKLLMSTRSQFSQEFALEETEEGVVLQDPERRLKNEVFVKITRASSEESLEKG